MVRAVIDISLPSAMRHKDFSRYKIHGPRCHYGGPEDRHRGTHDCGLNFQTGEDEDSWYPAREVEHGSHFSPLQRRSTAMKGPSVYFHAGRARNN
jgi:hypothetical protein